MGQSVTHDPFEGVPGLDLSAWETATVPPWLSDAFTKNNPAAGYLDDVPDRAMLQAIGRRLRGFADIAQLRGDNDRDAVLRIWHRKCVWWLMTHRREPGQ